MISQNEEIRIFIELEKKLNPELYYLRPIMKCTARCAFSEIFFLFMYNLWGLPLIK